MTRSSFFALSKKSFQLILQISARSALCLIWPAKCGPATG